MEYVISDKIYGSAAELEATTPSWNVYTDSNKPEILKDTNQVVYARITDGAGNVRYLSSAGFHVDTIPPTAQIKVGESTWKQFINNISFGLFFKETRTVEISAADNGSGVADIYYYEAERAMTEEEVGELPEELWTKYTGAFDINPDVECVIYVKTVDKVGNISHISSDGMVFKTSIPAISGVEDGQNYYGDTTFTVSEEYLDTVTVDGVEVTLTEGSYTILADNVIHTIMVTDKAGNCVTYEIGVYEEEESKPEIEQEEPAEIPKDTEPTDSEVSSNVEDASDAANYGLLIAAAGIVTVAMLGVVFIKRRRNKTGN